MPRGFQKGHKIRVGMKHSEEARKNISLGHIGIKFTQEHKDKLSQINIGNNRGFKKGQIPWNKGKKCSYLLKNQNAKGYKHTNETKKKISENNKGKKSSQWKGGITPINLQIRQSLELRLWKKAVLERDNFTCQKTGQRGGKLVVHHINNFADFPELRTSISNGIILSKESHIEFHKIYGKKNNSCKQLEEFLNKKI